MTHPDRLLIPEKLYGRESEIGALLAAFRPVAARWVSRTRSRFGYSGIGKSSVVMSFKNRLSTAAPVRSQAKFDSTSAIFRMRRSLRRFQSLVRDFWERAKLSFRSRKSQRDAEGGGGGLVAERIRSWSARSLRSSQKSLDQALKRLASVAYGYRAMYDRIA